MKARNLYVYFSLLFLDCALTPTSNYTLTLDVSSHVVVRDGTFNYILAGEEVTLTATAHRNNNSSNFTDLTNQSQVYYYNFQCHNSTKRWYPINCSKESTVVEVWHHGGTVECSVQLLTQDNKTLACNLTRIKIAGNVFIQITGEILLGCMYNRKF